MESAGKVESPKSLASAKLAESVAGKVESLLSGLKREIFTAKGFVTDSPGRAHDFCQGLGSLVRSNSPLFLFFAFQAKKRQRESCNALRSPETQVPGKTRGPSG